MPIINVDVGKLSRDQKKELVREMTSTLARISGVPEAAIDVVIRENDPDNIGVGGVLLSDTES